MSDTAVNPVCIAINSSKGFTTDSSRTLALKKGEHDDFLQYN